MMNDLRYAWRNLRLTPGLTATITLTLALGIGANTAIFSIVNTLLFEPLPYTEASRLMAVTFASDDEPLGMQAWPYPKYAAFAMHQASFDATAAYGSTRLTAVRGDLPLRLEAEVVTASYFPLLGVTPARGRVFSADEDRVPGEAPVVILSDQLWRQQFGSDPQVVGKSIVIKERGYQVIGVMPPSFRGQTGTAELWLTAMASEHALGKGFATGGSRWWMGVIARLAPGITEAQAAAQMPALTSQVDETFRARMSAAEERYQLVPLKALKVHPEVRRSFVLLLAAVGFVLLIACANSANLLLGRAVTRQKDFALRRALGAGRVALLRQIIIETIIIALAAGTTGLVVAYCGLGWLTTASSANTTGFWAQYVRTFSYFDISLDARMLAFNFTLALLIGALFGLAPAWQASRASLSDALKHGAAAGSALTRKGTLTARGALVLTEIALSLILLVGAGLLVQSFVRAANADLGLSPDDVVTMTIAPGGRRPPAFYFDLLERIQALPGVERAALSTATPMGPSGWESTLTVDARPADAPRLRGMINVVTPTFLETHGISVVEGRGFSEADTSGMHVAVITRAFADVAWPGQTAIGRRVRQEGKWHEVIGIAGDAVVGALEEPAKSVLYVPLRRDAGAEFFMVPNSISVRSPVDANAVARGIQAQLQTLDAGAPLFNVVTMRERVDRVTARYRYSAVLMAAMAGLALLLASVGTYGVIAYAVTSRTREIGIRMALGARPGDVLRLVLGGGLRLAAAGIAIGLIGAYLSARLLAASLYGVSPADVTTFAIIAGLMAAVSSLASYLPARRAMRVDPVVALRAE